MSIEAVLLIVAFVVLPLIQQLLQRSRQQDDVRPSAAPRPLLRQPHLPADVPQAAEASVPPQSLAGRQPLQARITAVEQPLPDAAGVHKRIPKPQQRARRRHSIVEHLRNPAGLRRAIVLRTVLEPCRAAKPYE
jgi:hypothetical protein